MNSRLLLLLAIFITTACNEFIIVQRSEDFATDTEEINKLICVAPKARILNEEKDQVIDLKKQARLTDILSNQIKKSAKRTDINLEIAQIANNEDKVSFYNDLLQLKNEMLLANNLQSTQFNFQSRPNNNTIQEKVFVYPPSIKHEFAQFSEKYGTPYYSFIGLFKQDSDFIFYHVMVNTNTAQTVFREITRVGSRHMRNTTISQLVYDSFSRIKKEIK